MHRRSPLAHQSSIHARLSRTEAVAAQPLFPQHGFCADCSSHRTQHFRNESDLFSRLASVKPAAIASGVGCSIYSVKLTLPIVRDQQPVFILTGVAGVAAAVLLAVTPAASLAAEQQEQQQQEQPHLQLPQYLQNLELQQRLQQRLQEPQQPSQKQQPHSNQSAQAPSVHLNDTPSLPHVQPTAMSSSGSGQMTPCQMANTPGSDLGQVAPPVGGPIDPVAEVASLFRNSNSSAEGEEPVDPFTLYGTTFKKFFINKMKGEKILSRQRGFTVTTCTAAIAAGEETPSFQGLPTGARVNAIGDRTCRSSEGPELKPACARSCNDACTDGLSLYTSESSSSLGFKVPEKAQERVLKGCRRQCTYECSKPGKAYDFVVPFRE